MGMGHGTGRRKKQKQFSLFKSDGKHQFNHGGILRNLRRGRKQRPLSCSEPLHLVFKINRGRLKTGSLRTSRNFKLANIIIQKYAQKFYIKIEQVSVQSDHIHLLIRTSRRSNFHYFFRVVAGQIAQQFANLGYLKMAVVSTSGDIRPEDSVFGDDQPEKSSLGDVQSKNSSLENLKLKKVAYGISKKSKVTGTPNSLSNSVKEGRRTKATGIVENRTEANQSQIKDSRKKNCLRFWKYRPFSRVVRGYKAYLIVRNYIQLNEKEAIGVIRYSKNRLKGLSMADWELLWD